MPHLGGAETFLEFGLDRALQGKRGVDGTWMIDGRFVVLATPKMQVMVGRSFDRVRHDESIGKDEGP
jgi:hypothetical protein